MLERFFGLSGRPTGGDVQALLPGLTGLGQAEVLSINVLRKEVTVMSTVGDEGEQMAGDVSPDELSKGEWWLASPLTIRLLFSHPTIDPEAITNAIGVQPCMQRRVGDPVMGLDGKPRRGVERQSTWSVWRDYGREPDIDKCLGEFIEMLQPHSAFVRQLAAEGYAAELILSYPGKLYFGGAITPSRLQVIADLGLSLGIEIFPDSEIA